MAQKSTLAAASERIEVPGKIMRRILRQIAAGEYHDLGDTSTLMDATVVSHIVSQHQAFTKTHGQ